MISRNLCIAALALSACGAVSQAQSQTGGNGASNVIKRLPSYVRLLPKKFESWNRAAARPMLPPALFAEREPDCAHIRIAPVTPRVDPGIAHRPAKDAAKMPLFRGLPPCPQTAPVK